MACPFATAATIGGMVVGSKILLFRDKYRMIMWLAIALGGAGWMAYYMVGKPVWLRFALEIENTGLLLGMITRLVYVIRVQRQVVEIPRFIAVPLQKIRPFALHPVTLALKIILLCLILLDSVSLIALPPLVLTISISMLVVWIVGLTLWRGRVRSEEGVSP
jgi:hypothetical protein